MKVKCYIQGTAAITPQHSFEGDLFSQPLRNNTSNLFQVTEPDYKAFIPPNSLRRMSRLLKMALLPHKSACRTAAWGCPAPSLQAPVKAACRTPSVF